jgi:hypothetical protein
MPVTPGGTARLPPPGVLKMQLELTQRQIPLGNMPPLVPLEFFAVALGRDMRSLIDDCDAGTFGHCWDISASPRGEKKRRELRVFYLDGLAIIHNEPRPDLSYDDCLAKFIPATRGLKGTELQRLWTCGPDLIHDLDEADLIIVERERLAEKGPRASRLYTRDSIIAFLNRRAVGDPRKN